MKREQKAVLAAILTSTMSTPTGRHLFLSEACWHGIHAGSHTDEGKDFHHECFGTCDHCNVLCVCPFCDHQERNG